MKATPNTSPARLFALGATLLSGSVISACGESSGSSAPALAAATPAAPVSVADALSAVGSEETQLLNDGSADSRSLLITGRSASDSAAFWQCETRDESGLPARLAIRYWQDGSGVAGRRSMTWALDTNGTDTRIIMSFADSRTTLNSVALDADTLSATDALGNPVQCSREGPRGNSGVPTLGDGSNSQNGQLASALSQGEIGTYSCLLTNTDGSVSSTQVSFLSDGSGQLDGAGISWLIDERQHVLLTPVAGAESATAGIPGAAGNRIEWHDVVMNGADSGSAGFTARQRQVQVSCSSQ